MGSNDTKKVYKLSLTNYEYSADQKPHKSVRKHKRRERQEVKKEIESFLKEFDRYKHSS